MACLSPSDKYIEENISTLNYAARASLISNIPTKNIDPRLLELNDQKVIIIIVNLIEKNNWIREGIEECKWPYILLNFS